MDIGVFAPDNIRDDRVKGRLAKIVSINAAANVTQRIDGIGMCDSDPIAIL
jgi:hypothetical protein